MSCVLTFICAVDLVLVISQPMSCHWCIPKCVLLILVLPLVALQQAFYTILLLCRLNNTPIRRNINGEVNSNECLVIVAPVKG